MTKKFKIALTALTLAVIIAALAMMAKNSIVNINNDMKITDYYSLSEFRFDGDFNEFYKDSYDWYKSIEKEDGVYLVNTAYYSDELFNVWKENNIYNTIPDKAFWYYTVSPSYLKKMNINLKNEELADAENGIRLYLIPDTLSEEETEKISAFLKEDALKNVDTSTIKTIFTDNKEIKTASYSPDDSYFTFPSDNGEAVTDNAPIIYVCTSANMKFYESESLISTGIDSYIKFEDEAVMKKHTENNSIEKYSLKFNKLSDIYRKAEKNKLVDKGINKLFNDEKTLLKITVPFFIIYDILNCLKLKRLCNSAQAAPFVHADEAGSFYRRTACAYLRTSPRRSIRMNRR